MILARHLAGGADEDIALALRELDADLESLVILLKHEHVLLGRRAERVPPDLERSHGLVGLDVEEGLAVGGPRGTVVNASDYVIEVRGTRKVAKSELMELGSVDV